MNDFNPEQVTGRIVSGRVGYQGEIVQYQRFEAGDTTMVEEFWWGELAEPLTNPLGVIADSGWVWVRFWLRELGTVLDRIFDADLEPVGTHIDVTMPIMVEERAWFTTDLLLALFIAPDGRVTVLNEEAFDRFQSAGYLDPWEVERAEAHVRQLTRWIATKDFPMAWILQYRPELGEDSDRAL